MKKKKQAARRPKPPVEPQPERPARPPEIPVQAGPSIPLARRTPMATLPSSMRGRQTAG